MRNRAWKTWGCAVLLCVLTTAQAIGQVSAPASTSAPTPAGDGKKQPIREISIEDAQRERARLEKAWVEAFNAGDYAKAETLLRELVPLDHGNFVPWYNLACMLSLQKKADESVRMLQQAIARGFIDRRQMETDPHLAHARASAPYGELLEAWDRVVAVAAQRRAAALTERYGIGKPGSPYRLEKNDDLNLTIVTAFDERTHADVKAELHRLAAWWASEVMPAGEADDASKAPNVSVVLPLRRDYLQWAVERYGGLAERVGGAYSHDEKQLVAMDLGSTLRHEFWHVLHWRDMDRRRQRHPHWVMEGLCSMVEDVELQGETGLNVLPNWRTNIVRRLAKGGGLTPWDQLMKLDQKRFMTLRPLAMYAQSRAIFMYLHERGKLKAWYTAYVNDFAADPSGLGAFETAFGKNAKEVERDFRLWARALPEVAEEIGRARANLPFNVSTGNGDGPVVADDLIEQFLQGQSKRDAGGLKPGDVITALNDKPVRDLNDLARILGEFDEGDIVTVAYNRRGKHATAKVKLVPPVQ